MKASVLFFFVVFFNVFFIGCGGSTSSSCTVAANITPASAIGDHSSFPANQVQFSTTGSSTGNCPMLADIVGSWATSDPANTSISNQAGSVGLATCLGVTTTPATITNSGAIRGKGFTPATLTCR